MIAALKLVPGWAWPWVIGAGFALLVGGVQQVRVSGMQADVAQARQELADYRAEVAERTRQAETQARAEEQRRQTAIEGIRLDAQEHMAAATADADDARAAAERLQHELGRLSRRPARCPGAAAGGEAADPARVLLAELFAEADRAAGELAAEADRARLAGAACERAYDSLGR